MDLVQNIQNTFFSAKEEVSLEEQFENMKQNTILDEQVQKIICPSNTPSRLDIENHVYEDLEFFASNDTGTDSIYECFTKHTITPYGKYVLRYIFQNPTYDTDEINKRQQLLQYFIEHKEFGEHIKQILQNIENPEDVFWLWKKKDEQTETLFDMVYFQLPVIGKHINANELILQGTTFYKMFVSPFFSIMAPVITILVPYLFLRYMKVKVSFYQVFKLLRSKVFTVSFIGNKTAMLTLLSTGIWFAMYFYNLYTIFSMSKLTNNITNMIHTKLRTASQVIQSGKSIHAITNISSLLPESIKSLSVESVLLQEPIQKQCSIFSNKGCILATYTKSQSVLEDLSKYIFEIGYIDAIYSVYSYIQTLTNLPWTFSSFGKKRNYTDFWNPSILSSTNTPVPNSLGGKKKTNTFLITGPNAGGKSTFVKTIFVNSILSQTIGIAFAKKWVTTKPYKYIDTYFHVPDIEGKASTFQAEMRRCFTFIEKMKTLNSEYQSLVALDEVFTSTNYKEGIAGAYSILKYISNTFTNVCCLVTTHYHSLGVLEKDTKKKVMNYCVEITRDSEGKLLENTYKVHKGISEEHIALDLLEMEGFSKDIISIARDKYKTIQTPNLE